MDEVRVDIIDRLNKLQNGDETKSYKIIDEFDLEKALNSSVIEAPNEKNNQEQKNSKSIDVI